jgi:hypothetical protein
MQRQIFIACLAAAAACSSLAYAGDKSGTGNNGNGNGNTMLTLANGDTFTSPGKMFQYLRTRTDLAAGNPKAIVDAYPDEFDNVGDLIQQKRDATASAAPDAEAAASATVAADTSAP